MKIDKAIQILELETSYPYLPINADLHDAQKLGIEALKFVQEDRLRIGIAGRGLLKGE